MYQPVIVCQECESEFKVLTQHSLVEPSFCPFCGTEILYTESVVEELNFEDEDSWD